MVEQFEQVNSDSLVFRFAPMPNPNGVFPPGAVLPAPEWFNPTTEDREEAAARGRVPGWSCWNRDLTSVAQARVLIAREENQCFGLTAWGAREAGRGAGVHVDVLADPAQDKAPSPGWEGHAVIEGLARPEGAKKATYKALWRALRDSVTPVSD